MKKRLLITIPLIIVLVASIVVTQVLANTKPNTSHISNDQKLATLTEPAVLSIYENVDVTWELSPLGNEDSADLLTGFFAAAGATDSSGSSGSGFIISENGYIVTNAHVINAQTLGDQELANLSLQRLTTKFVEYLAAEFETEYDYDAMYNFLIDRVVWTKVEKSLTVVLPGGTLNDMQENKTMFEGELKSFGASVGEGKDVAVLKIEANNLPTLKLADSEEVQLQDSVLAFGYPAAARSAALSSDAILVGSVTSGKISAVNKTSTEGAPVIQMDTATTHGSSGGPVIQEDGDVIGITTFRGELVNNQEVQGFNFVVPSNTIKEFVAQSGSPNASGEVDRLYEDGLELYWAGYFNEAILKFEAVQRLFPEHPEVANLIEDSQQNSSNSKILWSNYKTMFYVYGALALLIILLLLVWTFRGKDKGQPKQEQSIEEAVNNRVRNIR